MLVLAYLQAMIANLTMPLRRSSLVPARGVTFIEYALLAAIAVIIAAIFREQLTNAFQNLFKNVSDALGRANGK